MVDVSPIIQPVTKSLNDLGITVKDIDCPPKVEQAIGSTFGCTVTTDKGEKVPVTVTQKDDNGKVTLTWELGKDVVPTGKHLPALTAYAQAVSPDLTVSCPKTVILPGGNGKLTCDVKDSKGQSGKLNVPMKDGVPVADQAQWSVDQG
nr:protein of unknown function (DUF4333) [uncultured bacterium]